MRAVATTTASNRGNAILNQQFHFTAVYRNIKATIAPVLMWLSMVGGLL
jgi:hypothetical protein